MSWRRNGRIERVRGEGVRGGHQGAAWPLRGGALAWRAWQAPLGDPGGVREERTACTSKLVGGRSRIEGGARLRLDHPLLVPHFPHARGGAGGEVGPAR